MTRRSPRLLTINVLILILAAGAVLVGESRDRPGRTQRAEEFQCLVGGLGFGPTVDLTRCSFRFDPRLSPACPEDLEPVAGGSWFCPCQGCSIFYYRPLSGGEDAHGLLP